MKRFGGLFSGSYFLPTPFFSQHYMKKENDGWIFSKILIVLFSHQFRFPQAVVKAQEDESGT